MSETPRTILVVDDDLTSAQHLTDHLARQGFRVVTAYDGESALRLARDEHPSLVVTDLHLPHLDGFTLIFQLRELPELAETPIIITTASFDHNAIVSRLGAPGQEGYLLRGITIMHKPIDSDALMRHVDAAFQASPTSRFPVLVVDDDQANLEMIERRLEVDDFATVLVETGDAALRQIEEREFQAVLLDLRLPDMSGLEVLAAIKQRRPELPVLIMTAHGSEALAVKALTEGASDYLIKPVSRRELLSALRSAIENMGLQTENRRIQKNLVETVLALKQSLQESERNQNRLESLMNAMDEGVLVVDASGQIERMNAEAMRALQLGVRPRTITELWSGILEAVTETGEPIPRDLRDPSYTLVGTEVVLTMASGEKRTFLLSTKSLPDQSGRLVMMRDITARRVRRERLETLLSELSGELELAETRRIQEVEAASAEAERLKADILSAVSHELRTPLNFIVGFGSVLADGVAGELTPEQYKLVEKMLHGAERLTSTVEDLLNFAMLTSGMLTPRAESVPLCDAVDEVVQAAADDARNKHVTLSLNCAPDLGEPHLVTDPGFLKNIVRQLVANAIKFTGDGGRVEVRVGRDGEGYAIAVADTGIGIEAEAIPRLFDHFYQVESHITRRFGGTGLGLALVKGLATQLQGRVDVESQVDVGSTFTLWLPARLEETTDGRHP